MTVKSISSIDHIHLQSYIDAISAFNTGEAIQTRKIFQGLWQTFDPTNGCNFPTYDTHQQYRIKPKPATFIIKYRIAKMSYRSDSADPYVFVKSFNYELMEEAENFIGWATDEQAVECNYIEAKS